jgi:hypothetical protein
VDTVEIAGFPSPLEWVEEISFTPGRRADIRRGA